ncbi:DNA polymerase [Macropodid alphaherpesvirus 1]|uniref:DNA polymerase n=1 Tax=Macropodid alphaherpesvirus 1 TaxID=137443 RepID=A0A0Y0AAR8_9ALPH|nr:DNA polymerase [Macropodid alphaherpesvirus 1]AMB16995.1 DNA polymerase [Macropodid alphaherpesvirus 1]
MASSRNTLAPNPTLKSVRAASNFFRLGGQQTQTSVGSSSCVRRNFYKPQTKQHFASAGKPQKFTRHTYYSTCGEFKFIAPRALDEDAAPDQRSGVHRGQVNRPPKVYCDGEERDILDSGTAFWPRRTQNWGDNAPTMTPMDRLEPFHIYDIVESVEYGHNPKASLIHGTFINHIIPSGTIITLLGLTESGRRIAVHVYGTRQYFYMAKDDVDRQLHCKTPRDLCEYLATTLRETTNPAFRNISADQFEIEVVTKSDIYYYDTLPTQYYRIYTRNGRTLSYLCDNFHPQLKKFECGVDATTRFILNNGFVTFGWYRLKVGPNNSWAQQRPPAAFSTSSDIEINCTADHLAVDIARQDLPNYKLLCFDIECKAGGADELAFPVASNSEDLIIQISCILHDVPSGNVEHILLFSLGACDIPDAYQTELKSRNLPSITVLEFDSEFELLLAFMTFFKQYGPEFITGYNIINFDWPFIVTKLTDIYEIPLDGYGRLNSRGLFKIWDVSQSSFQKRSKIKVNGAINIDMYGIITEKVKLSSYKLNAVAEAILQDKKKDLNYRDIPEYFAAGADKRGVIAEYCIQDSLLVSQLFFKFHPHLELAAVARLAGISLARTIYDGQQIRVFTCLLRLAGQKGFILPDNNTRFNSTTYDSTPQKPPNEAGDNEDRDDDASEDGDAGVDEEDHQAPVRGAGRQVGYQGAKVLDPTAGFHVYPVVVFDFASLYPSIIQAYNLCFSTLTLRSEAVAHLDPQKDYLRIEVNGTVLFFVKPHIRESLLSILLKDWLAMRKQIRRRIPESSPEDAVLLDKQQAAIKVVCNSVYGFTGVQHGLLPCIHVAATVTTIGRDMLLKTRAYVHSRWATFSQFVTDFPSATTMVTEGPFSMTIIYGDTDSIFVKCCGVTAEGLVALGDAMANQISQALFPPPIKLECEKTFTKLLLIAKKKYVGVIHGGKMLIRGVDLVRKNNCAFINRTSKVLVDLLFYNDVVSGAAAELAGRPAADWLTQPLPPGLKEFGSALIKAHEYITDPNRDINDFILTAELSRPPAAYTNKRLAHLTVYYKLMARREQVPSVKDRIPYVIVAQTPEVEELASTIMGLRGDVPKAPLKTPTGKVSTGRKPSEPKRRKLLISELAEDPTYVITNNVPLNTDYYFSHLLSAACVTFKALFGNDTKITENLLKRFIPEVWHQDEELVNRLKKAGFEPIGCGITEEETHQRLCTAFDILTGNLHQN